MGNVRLTAYFYKCYNKKESSLKEVLLLEKAFLFNFPHLFSDLPHLTTHLSGGYPHHFPR